LTFELVFYVAASGFSRIKQFPISEFILGGIVVFYAGFDLGALPIRSSSLLHFFVLIGTFLVGNVLYNQWSGKLENRWFLALSIGFGTTATLAWLKDAYGFHGTGSAEGLATVPFLVGALIGYATFFLVWSQPDSRFPKWLLWTGKVSYSIYLLHGVLLLAQPILGPWGTALLLVVGIPLLGWLGFNKVEQPFIAYSRKLRPRREPAVAVRQAS
jgi:peptidoglycan/LPS O-acetylase OafA/YrhL